MPVRMKRKAGPVDLRKEAAVRLIREAAKKAVRRGEKTIHVPFIGVFRLEGDAAVDDNLSGHFRRGERISLK